MPLNYERIVVTIAVSVIHSIDVSKLCVAFGIVHHLRCIPVHYIALSLGAVKLKSSLYVPSEYRRRYYVFHYCLSHSLHRCVYTQGNTWHCAPPAMHSCTFYCIMTRCSQIKKFSVYPIRIQAEILCFSSATEGRNGLGHMEGLW